MAGQVCRPPVKDEVGSESADAKGVVKLAGNHNALVIPMSDGYAVSCSCGWTGESHRSPEPAKQEAREHEADPAGGEEVPHTGRAER